MKVYTMTSAESELWRLGGQAKVHVETQIADLVMSLTTDDVIVRLDDGSFAYTLEVE